MKFLEKDLEDIIYENFDEVRSRGLDIGHTSNNRYKSFYGLKRQVGLGKYGAADLIHLDVTQSERGQDAKFGRKTTITIIECKLDKIDVNAYMQAKRYATAIRETTGYYDSDDSIKIRICLIGSRLELSGDFLYTLNFDDDCDVYTYSYGVKGITFERHYPYWTIDVNNIPRTPLKNDFLKVFREANRRFNGIYIEPEEDTEDLPF